MAHRLRAAVLKAFCIHHLGKALGEEMKAEHVDEINPTRGLSFCLKLYSEISTFMCLQR